MLVPAGRRISASVAPAADAWMLVLAGTGTLARGPHGALLRPGYLVRVTGPATAGTSGLACLVVTSDLLGKGHRS